MANEPQWEPIEAPPWATKPAQPAEPKAAEPKWEPIEPPAWATKQPERQPESKPPTLGRVLERAGEAASGTFKSGLAAGKKLFTPRTKEEMEEGYGVAGALKGLKETGEGLLSPLTMTIGALTSGVASPIASGVSEAARRITGGDPKHSEKAYEYALPMAEAAFGAVGRVPGAGASKMPAPITPKVTTVPGKGPEAEAGRYLESEARDPAALRQKLDQPIEELGGAGDKPTLFQHTDELGQVEKATARRPGQVEPHLDRKAAQNAARQETLERMQPAGDPMAAVNDLRTAMQAETQAGDAAAAAAQQRATQLIEAEGGRLDPTTYGNIFRRELEIAEDAARTRERALWRQVDPDGTLQSNPQPIQELERRVYGNLPQAASLSAEETRLAGVIQSYRPVIPFSELTALRSEVSGALRNELYTNGRTPAYARLSQLRQGIEEAIPRSFTAEGEAATGVAERLRAASAATRQRAETFRPTRAITRKEGVEGPYKLEDVSTIPEKIIASGTKGYDHVSQYLRAVGNERGLPELTDAVVARMRREVIGADGEVNPRKLEGFLRRYQDTLRAIDAADGGVFSARLRNIQTAQEAIETTTANRAAITKKYQDDQFNRLIGATNETDATSMIANIFGKQDSVARAQELMRRLTTAEAQEGARAAIVRHIREMLTSNAQLGEDLLLRAEQFQRWVQNSKNNGALRQILRPEQVEALEKIALSLRRANKSNQTKAVGGGSDTYQNFLAGQAQQGAVRELAKQYGPAVARVMAGWLGGPAGAITAEGVGFGLRTVGKARAAREAKRIETVQSLIDDAILNPEKAKEYLGKTQTTKSRTPGAKRAATYGAAVLDEEVRSRDDKKRVPRQAGGGVPAIGGIRGRSQGTSALAGARTVPPRPGQALSDGGATREQQPASVEAKPLGFRERHAAMLAGTPASGPAFEKIQARKAPTGVTREDIRRTLQTFGISGEAAGGFGDRQLGERADVDSRATGGSVGYADGGLTRGSEGDIGNAAAAFTSDDQAIAAIERMHRSRMQAQGIQPQGTVPAEAVIDQTQKYVAEQLAGIDKEHEKEDPEDAAIEDMGGFRHPPGDGGSDEGTLPLTRADGGEVEPDPYGDIFHALDALRTEKPHLQSGGIVKLLRMGEDAARSRMLGASRGQAPIRGLPQKPLEVGGEPFIPGPSADVREAAEQYMREKGMPYTPVQNYVPVDEPRARAIARTYDAMPHRPTDPEVQRAYEALANETRDQYEILKRRGTKFEPVPRDMPDPYGATPRLAAKDFLENKHMYYFPTEAGFGSEASGIVAKEGQKMLEPSGVRIAGKEVPFNDLFRVVHDVFGHHKEGVGFRAAGEENAWRSHGRMYSPEALPAMTAETRGQNSWVNYGPYAEKNKGASAADTVYAPQKLGILPPWVVRSGRMTPLGVAGAAAALEEGDRESDSGFRFADGGEVDQPPLPEPVMDAWESGALRQRRGVLGAQTMQGRGRPGDKFLEDPAQKEEAAKRIFDFTVPQTPLDFGLMALGGPFRYPVKAGALALGAMLEPSEAEAGKLGTVRKITGTNVPAAGRSVTRGHNLPPEELAPYPHYAEEYPAVGPPAMKPKTKPKFEGETYPAKQLTPEAEAFQKDRLRIQKEMDAKGYTPFFDPAQRTHVDPSNYPAANVDTLTVQPRTAKTLMEYQDVINMPATRELLQSAYERGLNLGDAKNWYAMAQLEEAYTKELGPQAGRKAFLDEFAVPMSAMTSGNDPETNFLLAQYAEYLRKQGKALPEEGHQLPVTVGGRRGAVNIRDYNAMRERGGYQGLGADQPKMHNFTRNIIGDPSHATIDEQMATGMSKHIQDVDPKFPDRARRQAFGLMEKPVHEAAAAAGVAPANYQDVAWAGFKNEPGKPLISTINDAIERTHRLTGMPREEIVRRGLIRKEIPIYGLTAAATPYLWGGFQPQEGGSSNPNPAGQLPL